MDSRLDDFDIRILGVLAENGRISWADLAERIGLSPTPTLRRVRALESEGYISGYHASIDEARVGGAISVFVSVSLATQTDEALATFESRIVSIDAVMSCFMMSGTEDYLLRVVVPDLHAYQAFISTLTRLPNVSRVTSSFAIKPVILRSTPALPRTGDRGKRARPLAALEAGARAQRSGRSRDAGRAGRRPSKRSERR